MPKKIVSPISDEEIVAAATRIAMSAATEKLIVQHQQQLQLEQHTSSSSSSSTGDIREVDMVKAYIKMCPLVRSDSPFIQAALKGLDSIEPNTSNIIRLEPEKYMSSSSTPVTDKNPMPSSSFSSSSSSQAPLKFETIRHLPKGSTSKRTTLNKPPPSFLVRTIQSCFGYVLRTLLFDIPLLLIFATYLFAVWTHRVHDLYLYPQLEAAVWTEERSFNEESYYYRICDASDQSTVNGSDLFLPMDATPEDAYRHQLVHGMTVFQSVLSETTSTNLRNFVRSRNFNLTDEESIFVISNEKRYSFGLGTEEPSVATAMKELASHERLRPALERILGPNPALIEMTAITSTYGAKDQYWHDDVVSSASAIQFARAFGPSYSIFIQLQNTTKQMGATAACPGTHFCSSGAMEQFCEQNGFQVVGEDGFWKTGDAMLMNMNIFHRGAAHVQEGGEDRVMLILTFVPRPRNYAESRQLSQGITFSLRWDMWGHTLDDLAHADTRMAQPWATLRALGLYKHHKDADWGIDFVHSGIMRIANGDNGFRHDELETWIQNGGFKILPKFLEGQIDLEREGWPEYYFDTLHRCEIFLYNANIILIGAYLALQVLILIVTLIFSHNRKTTTTTPLGRFGWALGRLILTHGIVFFLFMAASNHVDSTQWARDIRAGRRYTNPYVLTEREFTGISTYPHREDVLFETRYKSADLAMYNDFIMTHPGNRVWKNLLDCTAPLYASYVDLPDIFRTHLAEFMVSSMEFQQRRFLYQGPESYWHVMSRDDAIKYNDRQLKISSSPLLRHIYTWIEYLISEYRYGHLRDTSMVRSDALPFLNNLAETLLAPLSMKSNMTTTTKSTTAGPSRSASVVVANSRARSRMSPKPRSILIHRTFQIPQPNLGMLSRPFQREKFPSNLAMLPTLVEANNDEEAWKRTREWINEGMVVEVRYKEGHEPYKWYYATVFEISSFGLVSVTFGIDDQDSFVKIKAVRRYEPFRIGENVEVMDNGKFHKAKVLEIVEVDENDNMLLALKLKTSGEEVEVSNRMIRRTNRQAIVKKRKTKYY